VLLVCLDGDGLLRLLTLLELLEPALAVRSVSGLFSEEPSAGPSNGVKGDVRNELVNFLHCPTTIEPLFSFYVQQGF